MVGTRAMKRGRKERVWVSGGGIRSLCVCAGKNRIRRKRNQEERRAGMELRVREKCVSGGDIHIFFCVEGNRSSR